MADLNWRESVLTKKDLPVGAIDGDAVFVRDTGETYVFVEESKPLQQRARWLLMSLPAWCPECRSTVEGEHKHGCNVPLLEAADKAVGNG